MLEGKKVSLKAVERKDLPKLLEWRNKKNFKKFFREYRILNINQQKKWFLDVVEGDKKTVMFSIILNKNQQLIGACGLTYINWVQKNADFSIYIGDKNIYIDNVLALEAGSYPEENVAFPSIDSLLPEIRFAEIKFDVIVPAVRRSAVIELACIWSV